MQSVTQAMDKYGQAYVQAAVSGTPGAAGFGPINPGTGATNLGKAEDTAHASGDVGVLNLGVRNDNALVNLTDANGDNAPIATNIKGALFSVPYYDSGVSNALNGLKAEDSAAASGDALVGVAGVVNYNLTSPTTGQGDYSAISLGISGQVLSTLVNDGNITATANPLTTEDATATNQDAMMKIATRTNSALASSAATNNDYVPFQADELGRTITTLAPAGESWQACGTSTASTADVLLKAAVASNRIYVTNITCKNTSATVGTTIDFKDAAGGTMAVGGVSSVQATAAGTFTTTFPVPLRGTSNQNLNFAANVAVTSLTCCASGYVSVN